MEDKEFNEKVEQARNLLYELRAAGDKIIKQRGERLWDVIWGTGQGSVEDSRKLYLKSDEKAKRVESIMRDLRHAATPRES